MVWLCKDCGTNNDDEQTYCEVCGSEKVIDTGSSPATTEIDSGERDRVHREVTDMINGYFDSLLSSTSSITSEPRTTSIETDSETHFRSHSELMRDFDFGESSSTSSAPSKTSSTSTSDTTSSSTIDEITATATRDIFDHYRSIRSRTISLRLRTTLDRIKASVGRELGSVYLFLQAIIAVLCVVVVGINYNNIGSGVFGYVGSIMSILASFIMIIVYLLNKHEHKVEIIIVNAYVIIANIIYLVLLKHINNDPTLDILNKYAHALLGGVGFAYLVTIIEIFLLEEFLIETGALSKIIIALAMPVASILSIIFGGRILPFTLIALTICAFIAFSNVIKFFKEYYLLNAIISVVQVLLCITMSVLFVLTNIGLYLDSVQMQYVVGILGGIMVIATALSLNIEEPEVDGIGVRWVPMLVTLASIGLFIYGLIAVGIGYLGICGLCFYSILAAYFLVLSIWSYIELDGILFPIIYILLCAGMITYISIAYF